MSTPVYMSMGKNKGAEEQTVRREGTGKTEGGLPLFFKNGNQSVNLWETFIF